MVDKGELPDFAEYISFMFDEGAGLGIGGDGCRYSGLLSGLNGNQRFLESLQEQTKVLNDRRVVEDLSDDLVHFLHVSAIPLYLTHLGVALIDHGTRLTELTRINLVRSC
jgi:hypothetical protein